jgi:hypothetical protein
VFGFFKSFGVEYGFDDRFVRRTAARGWQGVVEGSTGHGGARITNMTNRGSVEHDDFESVPRMHASAWFSSEKETRAEEQPNEIGVGVYQIDKKYQLIDL